MKWLTRLSILAVFVLGAVTGAPLGMKIERDRILKMQREAPASLTENALRHIRIEVKLDPPQVDQLRGVLENARPALLAVEQERQGKIIAIMENVRTSAFTFLSEDQKQRYNSLHERMKNRLAPAASAAAAAALVFLR
jgi:hypothetical protein